MDTLSSRFAVRSVPRIEKPPLPLYNTRHKGPAKSRGGRWDKVGIRIHDSGLRRGVRAISRLVIRLHTE